MKQVGQTLEIYTRKTVVQLFLLALMGCVLWWLEILPRNGDHKWDAFMGVTAAVLAILLEQLAGVISWYRKLNLLDGHYKCTSFAIENRSEACRVLNIDAKELEKRLLDNPDLTYPNMAEVTIEYGGGAILHVVLQEGTHDNRWSGDCIMESDSVGIMAWAYDKLGERAEPWARNGIKRLAVVSKESPLKICLHSYNNDGRFGCELIIKDGDRMRPRMGSWPDGWLLNLLLICGSILALVVITLLGG